MRSCNITGEAETGSYTCTLMNHRPGISTGKRKYFHGTQHGKLNTLFRFRILQLLSRRTLEKDTDQSHERIQRTQTTYGAARLLASPKRNEPKQSHRHQRNQEHSSSYSSTYHASLYWGKGTASVVQCSVCSTGQDRAIARPAAAILYVIAYDTPLSSAVYRSRLPRFIDYQVEHKESKG